MSDLRLLPTQNLAIQARLNFMLGAKTYDLLFLGFECGELIDGILNVFVRTEYCAGRIGSEYVPHVAVAAESVIKRPIKCVRVQSKNSATTWNIS
jgi:hypothetical protein